MFDFLGLSAYLRQPSVNFIEATPGEELQKVSKPAEAVLKRDEAFERRVRYFRRLFARGAGRSPPALLRHALNKAAYCAADAERVRNDPTVARHDQVEAFREDRLAQKALEVAKVDARPGPCEPSLQELLGAV